MCSSERPWRYSSTRVFNAPNGQTYHWKERVNLFEVRPSQLYAHNPVLVHATVCPSMRNGFKTHDRTLEQLLDAETEAVVARSERKKLFSHSSRMSLTLEPELGQLVESVLFAFIIFEEQSRETAAGASSASAASSVAAAVA